MRRCRLADGIEVYPKHLTEYLKFANEVDRLSVERELGVVCLFSMQSLEDTTQTRYNNNKALSSLLMEGLLFKKVAASYSPALHCSTIGAGGLNFSVRNGKRWDPAAITT